MERMYICMDYLCIEATFFYAILNFEPCYVHYLY